MHEHRPPPPWNTLRSGSIADRFYLLSTWLIFTFAVLTALQAYSLGFERPLLDRHDFRQTQTAISTLFIARGGPLFAYETPVLGAPYSIPFEFPLFQWVAALIHKIGHVHLDQAGRVASISFFLLTLVPFWRLLRRMELSVQGRLLTLAMLLVAPTYLFWTRTFLLESTALFFSIAALDAGTELLDAPRPRWRLAWLALSASLAVLVKATTGLIYLMALGMFLLVRLVRRTDRRTELRPLAVYALCAFVVPGVCLVIWTRFADHQKEQNPLAHFIMSHSLRSWNYGTWEQKSSLATWQTLWTRTIDTGLGGSTGFGVAVALALLAGKRLDRVFVLILALLGGYAVFTNLHVVHDYYQYATVALAVMIVGLGYGAAEQLGARAKFILPLLAGFMVWSGARCYEQGFSPDQRGGDDDWVAIGKFVQTHTDFASLMVIYGDDWSSVLPYYSRRRALMDRTNQGPAHPDVQRSLALSASLGHKLEAILFCRAERDQSTERAQILLGRAPKCTLFNNCNVCL